MNYASIRRMDISNGDGIRVSLFVSGCNTHCPGCFNPEAQDFEYGNPYTAETRQLIIDMIADNPHIEGLSILGGDPLWQNEQGLSELIDLVHQVRKLGKTVWLWSGLTWETVMKASGETSIEARLRQQLVESCDVFVDGPFIESLKDLRLKWRGSSNQRVIDVQKSLKDGKVVLYESKNTI